MRIGPALLVLLAGLTAPAFAQTGDASAPAAGENGRFTMTPAANGFLRLDTRTGTVSLCTVNGGSAECRTAADDRAALTGEIERLSKRNAELEAQASRSGREPSRVLPNEQDVNRAMDYAERFMRRMMRIMRDENKDPT